MIVLAVLVTSGLGAVARYGLAGIVQRRSDSTRPWGTALVNVGGALLLGVATGLHAAGRIDADVLVVLGMGFLGGFTTFSTWMVESVLLGEPGVDAGLVAGAANLVVMLVAGIAGAAAGVAIGTHVG